MMKLIPFAFLACGFAQPSDLVFSLTIDTDGKFIANISVPSVGVESFPAIVNMGSVNTVLCGIPIEISAQVSLRSNSESFSWNDRSVILTNLGRRSYLTVGPESELTRTSGSVAIIRGQHDAADLVVRSSLGYFNASCTPGTLMQILFSDNYRVNGSFSFSEDTPTNLTTIEWHTVEDKHFHLPIPIIESILVTIRGAGATTTDSEYVFADCTDGMFSGLPNINLFIRTSNGGMSRLVFFPEDYASISDGICRFRIAIARDGVSKFNPLQVMNLNLRISSNNVMELCDAREQ